MSKGIENVERKKKKEEEKKIWKEKSGIKSTQKFLEDG